MGPELAAGGEKGAMIPLFAEAALLGLVGFAVGLLLAYLAEQHRRRQARSWTGSIREGEE